MPIQFQSVGAPNLDTALVALNNAYANQQTNLGNLVKVGTDFGATAQANNDINVKEYINNLSLKDLADKKAVQLGLQNTLPTNDFFGYNRQTAVDLLDKQPEELNKKLRDTNLTTRDMNVTALDNQKTEEQQQTYLAKALAQQQRIGSQLSRSSNSTEREQGRRMLTDVSNVLGESPGTVRYLFGNNLTGLENTDLTGQISLDKNRDTLRDINTNHASNFLRGVGVRIPINAPLTEDDVKFNTNLFVKNANKIKKEFGIDVRDPSQLAYLTDTMLEKQLDSAGGLLDYNKKQADLGNTQSKTTANYENIALGKGKLANDKDRVDIEAYRAVNGNNGSGGTTASTGNKPSAQYTGVNKILEDGGVKGGMTQNADGTFSYNAEAIRSQISNTIDQSNINARVDTKGAKEAEAKKSDYAMSRSGLSTKGQDMHKYLATYSLDGKPLLPYQREYLWSQLGYGLTLNDWSNSGDDGEESAHKNFTKLLEAREKEIDNNTNSLGITSKLGTMITGIATATNKSAGSVIMDLGLNDPKVLAVLPAGMKKDYETFTANQKNASANAKNKFGKDASSKRLNNPDNKSTRAQRMQRVAKQVNGKRSIKAQGVAPSTQPAAKPVVKALPKPTTSTAPSTKDVWNRLSSTYR